MCSKMKTKQEQGAEEEVVVANAMTSLSIVLPQ